MARWARRGLAMHGTAGEALLGTVGHVASW